MIGKISPETVEIHGRPVPGLNCKPKVIPD